MQQRVKIVIRMLLCGVVWISICGCQTSSGPAPQSNTADAPIEAAFEFLYHQMDQFNRTVVVAGPPGYQAFYPSGFMGDQSAISIASNACVSPRPGKKSCLRIDFHPESDARSGVFFQYPAGNWGCCPGRDLTGATRLSFWARAAPPMIVMFATGGINRKKRKGTYSDSFGPLEKRRVWLSSRWEHFEVDLTGQNLSSVIGAFAISTGIDDGGRRGAIFLDDVEFNRSILDKPRFLQSYDPQGCALVAADNHDTLEAPVNTCYLYDQALVLLAFLARGTEEDLSRAELIADTLVQAQENDRTFSDGRLRNAYASGPLIDPSTGYARLPGQWVEQRDAYIEDVYAAGSDTGNMAWAAIALVQAHALLAQRGENEYLNAARHIARWIVDNQRVEDRLGGFRGGVEGFEPTSDFPGDQTPSTWRSTEHNIDLVALFRLLSSAVGKGSDESQMWSEQQAHARRFVQSMWGNSTDGSYLRTGTEPGSTAMNKVAIPLDVQAWSILGMGEPERYENVIDWALHHCGSRNEKDAFDFNCNDGDGAWWEGTAQMVTALNMLAREEQAVPIIESLKKAQLFEGAGMGALPAASHCGLTTGFKKDGLPWLYTNNPHIGATAWFIFALMGKNPYDISPE